MHSLTIDSFVTLGVKKTHLIKDRPGAFFAGTVLAGAYVGLGILLIFTLGATMPPEFQKLVMGLTFCLALLLVVLAGAELFTGHIMYLGLSWLAGRVQGRDVLKSWALCWLGNLLGSVLVAGLFVTAGANGLLSDPSSLVFSAASKKMSLDPLALLAKGLLCNWLVCLALWMSAKVDSDMAKGMVIFWCLLAFIGSGYEHSVANMTLFSLAVMGSWLDMGTLNGALYNLFFVSLGNILGGFLMVSCMYWLYDGRHFSSLDALNHPKRNHEKS